MNAIDYVGTRVQMFSIRGFVLIKSCTHLNVLTSLSWKYKNDVTTNRTTSVCYFGHLFKFRFIPHITAQLDDQFGCVAYNGGITILQMFPSRRQRQCYVGQFYFFIVLFVCLFHFNMVGQGAQIAFERGYRSSRDNHNFIVVIVVVVVVVVFFGRQRCMLRSILFSLFLNPGK